MADVICYCYGPGLIWFTRGFVPGGHNGQDIVGYASKTILVPPLANGGTVVVSQNGGAGDLWTYGEWIQILHVDGFYSRYAHLSRRDLRVGDIVATAQAVGVEGNTGNSFGSHLHVELFNPQGVRVDPQPLTGFPNNTAQGYYNNIYDPDIPTPPTPVIVPRGTITINLNRKKEKRYGRR